VNITDDAIADDNRKRTTDISEWDQKAITVNQEMPFEIILAANYPDTEPLPCAGSLNTRAVLGSPILLHSDVRCKTVANMIKGKTPEEIRKFFNIVNDPTPEGRYVARCIVSTLPLIRF